MKITGSIPSSEKPSNDAYLAPAESSQYSHIHFSKIHFNIIPKCTLSSPHFRLCRKQFHGFVVSHMRTTYLTYLLVIDDIILIMRSSICSFHYPTATSSLKVQTLTLTLCSHILNIRSSPTS